MWRARASTLGWVSAAAVAVVLTSGATPASAQVVQSVQLGAGVFFPRGFDTRVAGDTLVADLADANPLLFEISNFTGFTVNGEWNVSFGHHLEVGAGIGYYKRTVHSVYRGLVNADGTEIRQDLRLRITPITGVVRFMPFGRQGELQPYLGVGVGAFNFRYSEVGQFVDPSDFSVFTPNPPYTVTGTAVGPIVLGGLRIPIKGDIYGFATEYRYQFASGDTGGIPNGFLGPKIDLSGGTLNFSFLIRF